ncbi:NAD(+) diphosphatase [Photobacterium galatheae]|uniref:NAD-capped RNA hydrolase NudC n=1 Tax=Photobacterium galatheae TaxID=1654360 RepID=A0A066RNE9_9GAMM|nr:NAD(+) diphosphatase [Photobacterium galatheae]KDM91990.1 NADH pyrophosphatase [Photobacterium galatheae]MCM0151278.1 NAD(+) diphosphatase [Photobacterium galatheae]
MSKKQDPAYWCVIRDRRIFLVDGKLPLTLEPSTGLDLMRSRTIGEYQGCAVNWLEDPEILPEKYFYSLRELLGVDPDLFMLAGKAMQLSHMQESQRYCSQCGGQTKLADRVLAMQCQSCQQFHYPNVSPCIIVAVRKNDQILLAQHPRHKNGMYTVIAGFVEPGETLEGCVAREVAEETGIELTNIRYFDSQPWAFPSNLMMGFLADYRSGDVRPDDDELLDAQWFRHDQLPTIAPPGTIAYRLIQATCDAIRQDGVPSKAD